MGKYIDMRTAASRMHCTGSKLCGLIRSGQLRTTKIEGNDYFLSDDLDDLFKTIAPNVGRREDQEKLEEALETYGHEDETVSETHGYMTGAEAFERMLKSNLKRSVRR